jgi:hypothetical protein
MKKRVLLNLILILIVFPLCYADDSWIYKSEKLIIDLGISSSINIIPESPNYYVDYVNAKVSFFPENDFQQKLLNFETSPDSTKKEDFIEFKWEEPYKEKLNFLLEYEIQTENKIKKITKKVDFPIRDLEEDYIPYTIPSEKCDMNNEIIKIASGLAEGEDDLYVVVHKIAEWVNKNIEYDIKYGKTAEKASWVMKNRVGTCDEISCIFISLCRAIKIPARYVSGVAYSNIPELEGFGNHAWAEVYFPDYGWVPFDATYGEFGFINPTHVKMKSSFDSGNSSTSYEWKGKDFDIEAENLEIKTDVKKIIGEKKPGIYIETSFFSQNTDFGSYNLLEASIKNLGNYYLPEKIFLSVPAEIYVEGEKSKSLVLKPYETKKVYWILKLTENLKRNYVYTLPASVYNSMNVSSTSTFSSKSNDLFISKQEINEIFENMVEEEVKTYSRNIELECSADKEEYYTDEEIKINCYVENTGNILLEGIKICADSDCETIDIGIAQAKKVSFSNKASGSGGKQAKINAENKYISKNTYLKYDVLDYPDIEIKNIIYPEIVEYKKDYKISFFINKTSYSAPQDTIVELRQNRFSKKWSIKNLTNDQIFNINLNSKTLKSGKNDFKIIVKFSDKKGKVYQKESDFSIELEKSLSF